MEQTEAWEKMMDTVRDPHPALRERRDAGEKVVGYFCQLCAGGLIHAAGAVPCYCCRARPRRRGGRIQQPFAVLSPAASGGLGGCTCDYSRPGHPHTCDTIRNLSDLVRRRPPDCASCASCPHIVHAPEAVDFMVEELAALRPDLEGVTGNEAGGADLRESIRLYNRCRSALDGLREAGPGNRRLYAAYLALQLTGPEEFLDMMGRVESGLTEAGTRRVAVIGGPVPQLEVFDLLEEYGMRVVWDDLCTASRFAAGMVAEDGEPLRALAESYLGRAPAHQARSSEPARAGAYRGHRGKRAEGVVFAQQAFCEFHPSITPG